MALILKKGDGFNIKGIWIYFIEKIKIRKSKEQLLWNKAMKYEFLVALIVTF